MTTPVNRSRWGVFDNVIERNHRPSWPHMSLGAQLGAQLPCLLWRYFNVKKTFIGMFPESDSGDLLRPEPSGLTDGYIHSYPLHTCYTKAGWQRTWVEIFLTVLSKPQATLFFWSCDQNLYVASSSKLNNSKKTRPSFCCTCSCMRHIAQQEIFWTDFQNWVQMTNRWCNLLKANAMLQTWLECLQNIFNKLNHISFILSLDRKPFQTF